MGREERGVGAAVVATEGAEAGVNEVDVVGLVGEPVEAHQTVLVTKTDVVILPSPETNQRFLRVVLITWMLTLRARRSWHRFMSTSTSIY